MQTLICKIRPSGDNDCLELPHVRHRESNRVLGDDRVERKLKCTAPAGAAADASAADAFGVR